MDFEEMNQRAYDRKPEPDGLTPAERMIWLALRLLYELHFHGGLTVLVRRRFRREYLPDEHPCAASQAADVRKGAA